jgi:hypothetical protein
MSSASRARATLLLLVCVGLIPALGQTPRPAAPARLRLKTGNHYASPAASTCSIPRSVSSRPPGHFIAIFQSVPNATDARNLRRLGYDVLAFVPDNGLLVYGNPSADLSAAGVIENYLLQAADKLSVRLAGANIGATRAAS